MRPVMWRPPVEPSAAEQAVIKAVRRAKLFVFLRQQRHEIFDEPFQEELAAMYADARRGSRRCRRHSWRWRRSCRRIPGSSDDEVVEACVMDRRWQLVLDCLDCGGAAFSKGTLVAFRERLIAATWTGG